MRTINHVVFFLVFFYISNCSHAVTIKIADIFNSGDQKGLLVGDGTSQYQWLRGGLVASSLQEAQNKVRNSYAGWHIATEAEMKHLNTVVFGEQESVWRVGKSFPDYHVNPLEYEFNLLGVSLAFAQKEIDYIAYLNRHNEMSRQMFLMLPGDSVPYGDPSLANVELIAPFYIESELKFGLIKDVVEARSLVLLMFGLFALYYVRNNGRGVLK